MHHRSIGAACLVVLSVAAGLCVPSSNGQEVQAPRPAELALSVAEPRGPLQPGGVGLVVVTAAKELKALEGEAFGRPVHFWPAAPTEWHGLLGVALETKPGSHVVSVHGLAAAGNSVAARMSIAVGPKQFETRRLRVDPTLVNPPQEQSARIEQEAKAMAAAFAVVRERLWRGRFEAPVPGTATSSFGRLTVMNGEPRGRHQGADFRAAAGTPVRAPNSGRVVLAQDLYFAGNTVILDHGLGIFSLLAHLSRIRVAVGDVLSRGDLIGESGATGRVTGPHLHWAVRFGDASVDPMSLIATVARMPNEDAPQASH